MSSQTIVVFYVVARQLNHLQLADDGESSDIGGDSLVDVAIQVDEGVPGVESNAESRVGRVDDCAVDVVASGAGSDGLERSGHYWSAKSLAEELAEGDWGSVDDDVGVGVLAREVVGKLNSEGLRSSASDGWGGESAGEEESSGADDHGGVHFDCLGGCCFEEDRKIG